ncbi:unnamed protein product [Aspergillus oryzae]|uniref:Unnamed protein product n=2 Tax=Aspergillus oryzae TaxID=5062 RepID=A0AAN4YQS1_ASPOZ|nr:unnamed protein product [Aspergillus oryzae]GMF92978.1 unnamed protein product [Aspergillus oryzae]GMG15541.1 unnamed protein product [Aspergillus oryzae]GMG35867.1 unnamed protein product [Aspergillus oryzae]GMG41074.1 unnamed protein product [Aspergillus oryzae var. brunneus]
MADVSLHDGPAPSAPSPRDADAPPASADSAGHSATPAISDELKARMDKVVYSDWKQTGLSAEKRVMEAEAAAEKAKAKYESLAEQYDRVKTGDKQSGKFGLKGPKSAAQHEEELLRKVQNADSDYASKVQAAQAARQELVSTHRPQAVHNIQQLISECDSGLTLQMQKFGTLITPRYP